MGEKITKAREEISVREALEILRKRQRKAGRRHSRAHVETQDQNARRIKLLRGLCGECLHIRLERVEVFTGELGISLRCRDGRSPLDLLPDLSLGILPECPSFRSRS